MVTKRHLQMLYGDLLGDKESMEKIDKLPDDAYKAECVTEPILTLDDLRTAFTSVCGITSCAIKNEIGQATVTIRYSWWTHLWFGLRKKAAKRAADYIHNRIPIGTCVSWKLKKGK